MINRTRSKAGPRAAVALLGLGALLGCSDLLGLQKMTEEPDEVLSSGIHPLLFVAEQTDESATVELHLARVDVEARIASFQGELKYDGAQLTLSDVQVPRGITGMWNEPDKGRIRFAGVSVEGIDGGAVLSLSFETSNAIRADHFELVMEELVASEAFQDLAPQLMQEGTRPRLSRTRPE